MFFSFCLKLTSFCGRRLCSDFIYDFCMTLASSFFLWISPHLTLHPSLSLSHIFSLFSLSPSLFSIFFLSLSLFCFFFKSVSFSSFFLTAAKYILNQKSHTRPKIFLLWESLFYIWAVVLPRSICSKIKISCHSVENLGTSLYEFCINSVSLWCSFTTYGNLFMSPLNLFEIPQRKYCLRVVFPFTEGHSYSFFCCLHWLVGETEWEYSCVESMSKSNQNKKTSKRHPHQDSQRDYEGSQWKCIWLIILKRSERRTWRKWPKDGELKERPREQGNKKVRSLKKYRKRMKF